MKKYVKNVTLALLLSTVVFGTVSCGSTKNDNEKTKTQKYKKSVDKMVSNLNEYYNESNKNSNSILVLENGKPIFSDYRGKADTVNNIPLTENTLYNIGSISKMYVTASILKLREDDKLSIDEPIISYIPEFKMEDPRYKNITLRMLLNHSSGLPGVDFNSKFLFDKDTNSNYFQEFFEDLQDENLKSNPGEYMTYCNEGFTIAQYIVEKVSGTDYGTYLKETFLEPMELKNTYLSSDESLKDNMFSRSYDKEGNLLPREIVTQSFSGTGGISTDANDLATFGYKILQVGVLNEKSIALLKENQAISTKLGTESFNNGLGWDEIDNRISETQVFKKGGLTTQYSSQLIVVPDENITIVGLSQDPVIHKILNQFVYDLLVEKGTISAKETPVEAPKEVEFKENMDEYIGVYNIASEVSPQVIKTVLEDKKLNVYAFISGNWVPTKSLTYREDGYFWSEEQPFGEYELYQIKEIDGKKSLIKKIKTSQYEYSVVYAQKLEQGKDNEVWSSLNGTGWLLSNIYRNNLDFGLMIAPLNKINELEGYFTFALLVPFKMIDNNTAGIASEVSSTTGKLIYENNTITYRGNTYIDARTMALFEPNAMKSFKLEKENTAQWYFISENTKITLNNSLDNVRMIIFNPDATVLFDNMSQEGEVEVPANSLIMFTGVKDTVVDLDIN